MSRRVSRIQATITPTVRIAPAMTRKTLVVTPTSATVMPDREQHRLDAAAGEVDLLAGGRDLGLERAHEM